jgi:hypothetical protein
MPVLILVGARVAERLISNVRYVLFTALTTTDPTIDKNKRRITMKLIQRFNQTTK